MKVYIIGDVHGQYATLMKLIQRLEKPHKLIFVGDLIDRGSQSKEAVDFVKNNGHLCVLGNHEQMFIDFYEYSDDLWFKNGGLECLTSISDDDYQNFYQFFKTLPAYIEIESLKNKTNRHLLVSHSSAIDCIDQIKAENDPLKKEALKYSIIWNRREPRSSVQDVFNIFGHTPVQTKPDLVNDQGIILNEEIGYANIDTGAGFNYNLTAVSYPDLEIIQEKVR